MTALLLGKPFHGQTRQVHVARQRLEVTVTDDAPRKTCPPGQSAGVTPRRRVTVTYYRVTGDGMPDGALVYARDGYEPEHFEEDAELVLRTFG